MGPDTYIAASGNCSLSPAVQMQSTAYLSRSRVTMVIVLAPALSAASSASSPNAPVPSMTTCCSFAHQPQPLGIGKMLRSVDMIKGRHQFRHGIMGMDIQDYQDQLQKPIIWFLGFCEPKTSELQASMWRPVPLQDEKMHRKRLGGALAVMEEWSSHLILDLSWGSSKKAVLAIILAGQGNRTLEIFEAFDVPLASRQLLACTRCSCV